MASQGPRDPGTLADDSAVGTVTWGTTSNASTSNNNYATAAVDSSTSHYLKATNFTFTIPTDATIDGIVVEIERKSANTFVIDNRVRIVKGGTVSTTDKSVGATWAGSDTYDSFGGVSDKWGETWLYSDINNTGFGVVVSCVEPGVGSDTGSVDHIRITVHYTEAASGSIPLFVHHYKQLSSA